MEILNGTTSELRQVSSRVLLGVMLWWPDTVNQVLSALRADAMSGADRMVLDAIRRLVQSNVEPDAELIQQELAKAGVLAQVEQSYSIADLIDYGTTPKNVLAHCKIVNEDAQLRELTRTLDAAREQVKQPSSLAEVLDSAEAALQGARELPAAGEDTTAGAALRRALSRKWGGLHIGFHTFDWATGGLSPGQLCVMAGRPGMGKTALAVCIADRIARSGESVIMFSLEMAPEEIAQRFAALHGTTLKEARSGRAKPEALDNLPVRIVHKPKPKVSDLRAILRQATPRPKLVIVDYLQLVDCDEKFESRREQVDAATRGVKWLAMEFEVPVLALAALNRGAEERGKLRAPVLSDLRESGGIESDADVVAMLHRPKYYQPDSDEAELLIVKQRQGPLANCKLRFIRDHATFVDAETGF